MNVAAIASELPQDFKVEVIQPYLIRFLAADTLDLRVGSCHSSNASHICLYIRVAPGKVATLTGTTFLLSHPHQPTRELSFPRQTYEVTCIAQQGLSPNCRFPHEVVGQRAIGKRFVKSSTYRDSKFDYWVYTAEPLSTFVGVQSANAPFMDRLFSAYANWYEYKLQILPTGEIDKSEVSLQLPTISVAGAKYKIPEINLKVAPTKLCSTGA